MAHTQYVPRAFQDPMKLYDTTNNANGKYQIQPIIGDYLVPTALTYSNMPNTREHIYTGAGYNPAMNELGDFSLPTRKNDLQVKKPWLVEDDDDFRGHFTAPKPKQALRQNEKWEALVESLDRRTPGENTPLQPTRCDPPRETSRALNLTRYGNPPKPSPFMCKSSGEIDLPALERYYDSFKNPRRATHQPTTKAPSAPALHATVANPPSATGANAIAVGQRRYQPQDELPEAAPKSPGPEEGGKLRRHLSMHQSKTS